MGFAMLDKECQRVAEVGKLRSDGGNGGQDEPLVVYNVSQQCFVAFGGQPARIQTDHVCHLVKAPHVLAGDGSAHCHDERGTRAQKCSSSHHVGKVISASANRYS